MRIIVLIVFICSTLIADTKHLIAPDGTTVVIDRDEFGVPHIKADNEAALFFGQGFAEANDRLYQIDLNRRAATGRLSEWFGSLALEVDKELLRLGYTDSEAEQMISESLPGVQAALAGYVAGVNAYVDTMEIHPELYKPVQYLNMNFDTYTVIDAAKFSVFMLRRFGMFGGDELTRLNELQNNGWDWFNENRPINDPACSTTIPDSGSAAAQAWHYSGMIVPEEVVQELEDRKAYVEQFRQDNGIINKLGSFAALISPELSTSGNVMLLGCPQMGAPSYDEASLTLEVELNCPGYHVGGKTVAGVPFVTLGHNEHIAWTWTSGASDNVDTYIDSTQSMNLTDGYWHDGEWLDIEVIVDTIGMLAGEEIFTHYRTVHGPVISAYLPLRQIYSQKMTFWMDEVDMADYIYSINKAESIADYDEAISTAPMSFNAFAIDQEQNIAFWHGGRFQDRSDGVHPYLPHKGDGSEEWGGFIPFDDMPHSVNPDQGYFTNWNNKPSGSWNNGDIGPWISGEPICDGVDGITDFVTSFSSMTLENVKDIPEAINDHGTYQGAYELTGTDIIDYNINPPGQSDLVYVDETPSPHKNDQWAMHVAFEFKDMIFGEEIAGTKNEIIPSQFKLFAPYPNPFNPSTTIQFKVGTLHETSLHVFDIAGRLVEELVIGELVTGEHEVVWNAESLSSGVYFVRLESGSFSQTQKLILLK